MTCRRLGSPRAAAAVCVAVAALKDDINVDALFGQALEDYLHPCKGAGETPPKRRDDVVAQQPARRLKSPMRASIVVL